MSSAFYFHQVPVGSSTVGQTMFVSYGTMLPKWSHAQQNEKHETIN